MKKILSLILVLTLSLLALVSCGGGAGSFTDLINETNPSSVKITVTTTSKALSDSLKSEYLVRYNSDGTATITGYYERYLPIDPDNPSANSKERLDIALTQKADGTYTDSEGNVADGTAAAPAAFKLNLSSVEKDGTVSESGDVFTVTVPKDKTEAVLGTAFLYDVTLEITKSEDMLEIIKLTYDSEADGVSGSIVCNYNK